jgi:hypothetical protein
MLINVAGGLKSCIECDGSLLSSVMDVLRTRDETVMQETTIRSWIHFLHGVCVGYGTDADSTQWREESL